MVYRTDIYTYLLDVNVYLISACFYASLKHFKLPRVESVLALSLYYFNQHISNVISFFINLRCVM